MTNLSTFTPRSRLRFVDQLVGDHPHPVGEGYKGGKIEHQLGPIAAAPVGQVDLHECHTILIDQRAYFKFALGVDSQSRRHFWASLFHSADGAKPEGAGQ